MFAAKLLALVSFIKMQRKLLAVLVAGFVGFTLIILAVGKMYQRWDDDPDRGAIAITGGAFNESYSTPVYLDQGWDEADSLWFYNTTQGSALLPFDFFMHLEQATSSEPFRANAIIDKYRYLPQKPTFFNPQGLPVGFARDTYLGKNYLGFTCAACHTGQVNYKGTAIRIDGGPAMADMVGFLSFLQASMEATLNEDAKRERFVERVLAQGKDFSDTEEVITSLQKWTKSVALYNTINHSHIDYGYARLDAFGRIYNRVLEYVLNVDNVRQSLLAATAPGKPPRRLLTSAQADKVLEGINDLIIGDEGFDIIISRLQSKEPGYPGLGLKELLYVRNTIFNEPSAPVSYPFLWDIVQSDYVQWNGLAANAGVGPLGRNTGEVIGVFGILDWAASDKRFNLGAFISGQKQGQPHIDFTSSINLVNLERLENHLKSLTSPQWPQGILGKIDDEKASRGQLIYADYCQSCHEVVERENWDRKIVAQMSSLETVGTDPAMALHGVHYSGKSGNFKHIYQSVDGVGNVVVGGDAPVVQILTAATKGVVGTPDPDKWALRRWADWLYTLAMSAFENDIKASVKAGNYNPDTTAQPYASLLAYKARSLNGIWATAPYLHNGSVPTLYDLLLPKKRKCDADDGEYRPDEFVVGRREIDPVKVGIEYAGTDGFRFNTRRLGDLNSGHEYAAGNTSPDGCAVKRDPDTCAVINGPGECKALAPLTAEQRWDLLEYLKTL